MAVGLATSPGATGAAASRRAQLVDALDWVWRDPRVLVGGAILLGLVVVAIFGPRFTSDPLLPDPELLLQPPSPGEWLGTDNYGRSVLARVVGGAQLDLAIALVASGLAFVVRSLVRGVSALWGRAAV